MRTQLCKVIRGSKRDQTEKIKSGAKKGQNKWCLQPEDDFWAITSISGADNKAMIWEPTENT